MGGGESRHDADGFAPRRRKGHGEESFLCGLRVFVVIRLFRHCEPCKGEAIQSVDRFAVLAMTVHPKPLPRATGHARSAFLT